MAVDDLPCVANPTVHLGRIPASQNTFRTSPHLAAIAAAEHVTPARSRGGFQTRHHVLNGRVCRCTAHDEAKHSPLTASCAVCSTGGAIGLITTHDLALTAIADELAPRAVNVHFQDSFEEGAITFDYRMNSGPVTRSNALALMRAVGLEVASPTSL
jgi:hypothetical protein